MVPISAGLSATPLLAQEASPIAEDGMPHGVTPERVAAAVEQIPELAASVLEQSGTPGMAVAVVYDDEVVYSGGFGCTRRGNGGSDRRRHRLHAGLSLEAAGRHGRLIGCW
jgi:CubicO group peptidase (beta-lactamase class C family)